MQETQFDFWVGKNLLEREVYPLQYSGLENSMDCIIHGVAKGWTFTFIYIQILKYTLDNFNILMIPSLISELHKIFYI